MNMRKITSMTLLLSGIVLLINSVVLYIVPEGRVAYWSDWKFWGLTKTHWAEQHTTVGILFCVAGILHIYYNWTPIMNYMKNKAKEMKIFTGSFNVALILTLFFVAGTYYSVPPMSSIINISEGFKERASRKYGEPPYGHAESSSLKMFVKREALDLEKAKELLAAANITITGDKQIIKEIARQNNLSPGEIHAIIKPAATSAAPNDESGGKAAFIDGPKSGLGKRKIADLCKEYDLDLDQIITGLAEMGVKADPEATMNEIAEAHDTGPMQVYEMMVEVVQSN